MIAIINLGPTNNLEADDPGGERNYEVRINSDDITRFKHCRRDGMATCLERAKLAVQRYEKKRQKEMLVKYIEKL